MTFSRSLKAANNIPALNESSPPLHNRFDFKFIFLGPRGLRAGWRLLIFSALIVLLVGGSLIIRNGGIGGLREALRRQGQVTITPSLMAGAEVITFLLICVATWVMGKIERRKFSAYGLPWRIALQKDFWVGALCGFLAISGSLLAMFFLHGFRITGLALHGAVTFTAPAAWAIAFLLAGLTEEFLCRGYLQYTLTSAVGFWPSAFVMSALFALGHLPNPNETAVGVASVVGFGLILCLFLRRTGNLWCAIGFHAAYDWGQTFYGVPDSGMMPYHNVFHSLFSGPRWLTGGVVGPEGSVLTPVALLITAIIFSRFYRENQYRKGE